MLVKEFMLGNTKIQIYDDSYKDKTQEDIDKIIIRIEDIASKSRYRQLNKELGEEVV